MGRPNTGKSTLFNRLVGRRDAVIHQQAGVTRDRKNARLVLDEAHSVTLVDTGGLFPEAADDFSQDIRRQAEYALGQAALVLFLVDVSAIAGLDHELAALIRRGGAPALLLANKIDRLRSAELPAEVYEFGFSEIFPIAANHGTFCDELRARLLDFARSLDDAPGADPLAQDSDNPPEEIAFALIGRPNVGKSSLMNALLERERAIVSPVAGTTRDSIDDCFTYNRRSFRAIDTAGLRRKARVREDVEFYSTLRAERSVEESDVTVLLLEEETLLTDQDKKIIGMVERAGRGLIFAVNKWDLAEDTSAKRISAIKDKIQFQLPEFSWAPVLTTSAFRKRGLKRLLDQIITVHQNTRRSIDTPELNRFVQQELKTHAPSKRGRQLKIYYAVQTGTAPPVFTFFVNNATLAPPHYIQYIRNTLRRAYEYTGVPIRITLRDKKE